MEQIDQRLGSFGSPVGDPQHPHLGLGELHRDGPGRSAGSQQQNPFPLRVHNLSERLQKCLAVGVLAHQPPTDPVNAVDRSHESSRITEFIQVVEHGNFVGKGQIDAAKPHCPHAADRVGKFFRSHFQRDTAPIQPGVGHGPLQHELGRVARHGLTHAADDFLERGIGHKDLAETGIRADRDGMHQGAANAPRSIPFCADPARNATHPKGQASRQARPVAESPV